MHCVTALTTSQLAAWEEEGEVRVQDMAARLEAGARTAADSERRAAELIRAGQRAGAKEKKELDSMRDRVETSNRLALHWQEEAALAGEALQRAEAEVAALRQQGPPAGFPRGDAELEQQLRDQLAALQTSHEHQLAELRAQHAAELADARQEPGGGGSGGGGGSALDQVEAVRAEAAAALAALEEEHAERVAGLLEERARMDSALRCIKDMTRHIWGGRSDDGDGDDDGGAGAAAGEDSYCPDRGNAAVLAEGLAVGIPVDASAPSPPAEEPSSGRALHRGVVRQQLHASAAPPRRC